MRILLRVAIPGDEGRRSLRDGSLGQVINHVAEMSRPEAIYCYNDRGDATIDMVVNARETDEALMIATPFEERWTARVELHPVLGREDLDRTARS
jgi:hypothetical protein